MRYDSKVRLTTVESPKKDDGIERVFEKFQTIMEDWDHKKAGEFQISSAWDGSQLFASSQTSSFDVNNLNNSNRKGLKPSELPLSTVCGQQNKGKILSELSPTKSAFEEKFSQNDNMLETSGNQKDLKREREAIGTRGNIKSTVSQRIKPELKLTINGLQDSWATDLRLSSATRLTQDDQPKTSQGFSSQTSPRYMDSPDLSKLDMILRSNVKKQQTKNQQQLNSEIDKSSGVQIAKVALKTGLKANTSLNDPDDFHSPAKQAKSISTTNSKSKTQFQPPKVKVSEQTESKNTKRSERADKDQDPNSLNTAPKKPKTIVKQVSTQNRESALDLKTAKTSFADTNSTRLSSEQDDGLAKDPHTLEKKSTTETAKKMLNTKNIAKKLPSTLNLNTKGAKDHDIALQVKAANSNERMSTDESKPSKPVKKILSSGSSFSFSSQEELTNSVLPATQEKINSVSSKPSITIETQDDQLNNEPDSNTKTEFLSTPNEKLSSQAKATKSLLVSPKASAAKKLKKESTRPLNKKNDLASQQINDVCNTNFINSPSKCKSALSTEFTKKAPSPWKKY